MCDTQQREKFFHQLRAELERLHANPDAWADFRAEIRSMDGTLADGLADNPWNENDHEDRLSASVGA